MSVVTVDFAAAYAANGNLPAGVSIVRAGNTATRIDPTGKVVAVAANTHRYDHDLAGNFKGLLVEPARKNYLANSNDFAGSYQPTQVTIVPNAVQSPDGTANASQITSNDGNGRLYQGMALPAAMQKAIASLFVAKAGGDGSFGLQIYDNDTQSSAGIVALTSVPAWQRYSSMTGMVGPNDLAFIGGLVGGAGSFHQGSSLYTFGHQVEIIADGERPEASSYILTNGATVLRAADAYTIDYNSRGVANGSYAGTVTFDDFSAQAITVIVAGGAWIVPTNLMRAWIRRIDIDTSFSLSVTGTTATSATFATSNTGGATSLDLQLSPRREFGFCVCPVYNVPNVTPFTISSLNQRATYFARLRTRSAAGVSDWSSPIALRTADGDPQSTAPAAVMIEPAIVVLPEPIMTWIPETAEAGFPAANMGIDGPVAYRAPTGAGQANKIDVVLSGAPIDTAALLNTNLPEAATVTLYAATTLAGLASGAGRTTLVNAVPFRASPNVPSRYGYHGLFRFAKTTGQQFFRWVIAGPYPAGTLYIEHMVMGFNRATKNYSIDLSETPQPKTTIERGRSGIPDRVDGLAMRKVQFDISLITEEKFETLLRRLAYHENEAVFIVPNSKPGAFIHDRMLYGDLIAGQISAPNSTRFNRTFGVNSLI